MMITDDVKRTNLQLSPRLTAASSLIASDGYRRLVLNLTGNQRKHEPGLQVNFAGSITELMHRATYSGRGDGLTSTDHRGVIGGGPGRTTYLQDLLLQGSTRSTSVVYAREVAGWTNAAGAVEGGDDVSEQAFDLDEIIAHVGNVSVFMKTTAETFADYLNVSTFISDRLVRRVKLKIEDLILNGDGTAPGRIVGFMEAGVPTVSISTAGSLLEAIQESIAQVEANGFTPTFIALNPTDKRALYSGSTSSPLLIWDGSILRLHGVPVIGTAAVTAGTGLVGDGSEAAIMYHSGISGSASYREEKTNTDQDDFTMNLITIRAGARAALVINNLAAFSEIVA